MAKNVRKLESPPTGPTVPPAQAITLLRMHVEKGRQLLASRPISSAADKTWETVTRDALSKAFGALSPNVRDVMNVGRYRNMFGGGNEKEWEQGRAEDMEERLTILEGLIESLETEVKMQLPSFSLTEPAGGSRVFLVHGHEEAMIHETARFLERLGLNVIVLREQPNQGRTIIEKFMDYSDVGFAVVLLAGDDRGGTSSTPYEQQKPRARQNVILELGFFLGRLGRKHVCALYQQGVEIPSDYQGVLFLPIDDGGAWRFALAREIRAAGMEIDLNKAS
jgi:predicted nucleotide-binding protein